MREKNPEEELKEAFRVFDAEGTGVIGKFRISWIIRTSGSIFNFFYNLSCCSYIEPVIGKFSFYNLSLCCSYNDEGTGVAS